MLVGIFNSWFFLTLAASSVFLGTVIFLLISNHKMKKEFDDHKGFHSH